MHWAYCRCQDVASVINVAVRQSGGGDVARCSQLLLLLAGSPPPSPAVVSVADGVVCVANTPGWVSSTWVARGSSLLPKREQVVGP